MRLWIMVLCGVALSAKAYAQRIDASDLDVAARSAQQRSVMFLDEEEQARMRYEEEQKRRYEEEKKAYEEAQRRAYEEEMKRAEAARRAALKPVNLFGRSLKIYAEVNGDVLTSRDMQDRVNVFVATTQIPVNKETKSMIMEKVFQSAIDEKIKLQEAQKNGINVTAEDLKKGFENFAKSNGVTTAEFRKMLKEAEVNESVFTAQMKAEMAWGRLIQRKVTQEVRITETDVNTALATIKEDLRHPKFMLSEIVIPKNKASHIGDLVSNLRQDPRFELYAAQFSNDPSARSGGRLGWVNLGQLAEPIERAIGKMKEGDISDPIAVGADYYIVRLEKVYNPAVDKTPIPTRQEVRQLLENRKTDEIASKYLRQLRQKAIVERHDHG